ncbi:MAG: sulfite exporter TauE/SafE family protein [Candidatus Odinarchaeota archaeon]
MENLVILGIIIFVVAFSSAFINSLIGGGYGTLATPWLILIGLEPLEFIPSLLLTHGLMSLFLILIVRRNFKNGTICEFKEECFYEKTALKYLVSFGVVGLILSMLIINYVNSVFIKFYIGMLTIFLGIALYLLRKKRIHFSKSKMIGVSIVAAFNKGISGGGYGTVISCGQILSGIHCKKAVSTSYYAETIISIIGFGLYILLLKTIIPWEITIFMLLGVFFAIPFAMKSFEKVSNRSITFIISVILLILGIFIVFQASTSIIF